MPCTISRKGVCRGRAVDSLKVCSELLRSLVRISLLEILLSPLGNARFGALSVEVAYSHTAFSDKVCGKSEGVTVGGR